MHSQTGAPKSSPRSRWLLCCFPHTVYAHELSSHQEGLAWNWEPWIIASLALAAALYVRGVSALWRRAGLRRGIRAWQAAAFALGWLTLALALISPLDSLGSALFSAHMIQHEVLMLVAAPLLVLSRPVHAFLWALPLSWRRRLGEWSRSRWAQGSWGMLTAPLSAWTIHAAALWIWHAPSLFQAALRSELAHALQHSSFLFSALLFWWALIHARGIMGLGAAVFYLLTTSIHSGVLGALLTFSSSLWYPAYSNTTAIWGLTAIEDQQLGGLIMWVPAGLVYLIAGLAFFAAWLRQSELRALKHESSVSDFGREAHL